MIKSQSVLERADREIMAEAFCRRTGAQLQDKPGDFLTVRFDSRGVSLSGFGLTYQGDFVETMLHRGYQRQTSA